MKKQALFVLLLFCTVIAPAQLWTKVNANDVDPDLLEYFEKNGYIRTENPYITERTLSEFSQRIDYIAEVTHESILATSDVADEFSRSEVGVITMFGIAYSIAGDEILKFFSCLSAFFILGIFGIYFLPKFAHPTISSDQETEDGKIKVKNKINVPHPVIACLCIILFCGACWIVLTMMP